MLSKVKLGLLLFVAVTIHVSLPSMGFAATADGCAAAVETSPAPDVIDEHALKNDVQIIWYPKSEYITVTHSELIVNGTAWTTFLGFKKSGTEAVRERAANTPAGRGYVSFHLKVSDNELTRIEEFLNDRNGKFSLQNCMSGACAAVTKNSGIFIPFPFSKVPTLAAAYLTVTQKLGYKRVSKIEWVGKKEMKRFFSAQPLMELWMTKIYGEMVYGLVLSGVDQAQNAAESIIPIFRSLGLANNGSALRSEAIAFRIPIKPYCEI